jgi:hypothetical protein
MYRNVALPTLPPLFLSHKWLVYLIGFRRPSVSLFPQCRRGSALVRNAPECQHGQPFIPARLSNQHTYAYAGGRGHTWGDRRQPGSLLITMGIFDMAVALKFYSFGIIEW